MIFNPNKELIFAVDFDGTLATSNFPDIGKPIQETIDFCKNRKALGDYLILWTNRHDERLLEAVQWCLDQGLIFDTVNENLPHIIEYFGGDCRKIFANYYIDDRNLSLEDIKYDNFQERGY